MKSSSAKTRLSVLTLASVLLMGASFARVAKAQEDRKPNVESPRTESPAPSSPPKRSCAQCPKRAKYAKRSSPQQRAKPEIMTVAAVAEATTAVEATTVTEGTTTVEATTVVAGTIGAMMPAVEAWELATKAGVVAATAVLTIRGIQIGATTEVLVEHWIRSGKAIV